MTTLSFQKFMELSGAQAPDQLKSVGVNTPVPKPQTEGAISGAFHSGVDQAKAGYEQAKNASNPLQLLEGGTKLAAGAINTAFSPLAGVTKPLSDTVNTAGNKLADMYGPDIQRGLAEGGPTTAERVLEDVGNLSTIAGTVAGGKGAGTVGEAIADPALQATKGLATKVGGKLKSAGEAAYGVGVGMEEPTKIALQNYQAAQPSLMGRVRGLFTGDKVPESTNTLKPTTEANTAIRQGLVGTEWQLGTQAKHVSDTLWNKVVSPALDKSKVPNNMKVFLGDIEDEIYKNTSDLTRRNSLIEALDKIKEDYKNVSSFNDKKLQSYKEDWAKFVPDAAYQGKPIANAIKEVHDIMANKARTTLYNKLGPDVKQAYIDYGNLQSIEKAGRKSVDPLRSKAGGRQIWEAAIDKVVTPVATIGGQILYKTGEGLEFLGKPGAKSVKDIIAPTTHSPSESVLPVQSSKSLLNDTSQGLKDKGGILETIKNTPNKQGGFASTGYKETGNLTTKILKDLEGKTTVSKQYILDATNRGELKQAERDITRQVLDTMKGDTINVKEFADKVKSELLPLKVKSSDMVKTNTKNPYEDFVQEGAFTPKYESIALPKETRGKVANYRENIYESPIATSAGDTHFNYTTKNYFGHTRIEDMADNKTRRVIEVQSDLYQKGNLERETQRVGQQANGKWGVFDNKTSNPIGKQFNTEAEAKAFANKPVAKLQQYNDPTAHFRMIREEIKKAAQDGKTKLQFPTGETAMKIEGLGQGENRWFDVNYGTRVDTGSMKVGDEITHTNQLETNDVGSHWIITDVLGDGKFKAIQKSGTDNFNFETKKYEPSSLEEILKYAKSEDGQSHVEQFDISGKVDTNNPIYKFYEKDVTKYLNKFGGKKVIDDKGVSWIEVPIKKEYGKAPVEAFGKTSPNVLLWGAGIGAGAVAANKLLNE